MSRTVTVAMSMILFAAVSCQNQPEGRSTPVPKELLIGTVCKGWTGGASKFEWTFSDNRFHIEAGSDPIPQELVDELVGEGKKAKTIDGQWSLAEKVLTLSDVTADGQPTGREGRLSATHTGAIRVTIPGRSRNQYVFAQPPPK